MDKPRHDRRLGSPPGDWNATPKRASRPSAETQRVRRADLGGPPREFGSDERPALPARNGPFTALIVSEDRGAVASLTFALAEAKVGIRIALDVDDALGLLDGCSAAFVVVPEADHPAAHLLERCSHGRTVVALVPDPLTAGRVRGRADVTLEAPWNLGPVLERLLA